MIVLAALLIFIVCVYHQRALPMVFRLGVVGVMAAATTAYFWIPFMLYKDFLIVGVYLPRWKFDSFGADQILTWLMGGELLDHGRLPVMTALAALGLAYAVAIPFQPGQVRQSAPVRGFAGAPGKAGTGPARLALAIFAVWLLLVFGRPTWGKLIDLVPLHEGLMMHRFIGGVDLAAILMIGLAGEWIWRRFEFLPNAWRAIVPGILILALMVPALRERKDYYSYNTAWIERTRQALDADPDWKTVLEELKHQPPGRVYAGLRANWGDKMRFGDIRFRDLLTFYRIPSVAPLYQDLSFNAELIFHFDDGNAGHYDAFNARYVIAPTDLKMTSFFTPIRQTPRYTLYRAPTSGYGEFVAVGAWISVNSQASLFDQNKKWLASPDPQARRYIRWNFTPGRKGPDAPPSFGDWTTGVVTEERIQPHTMEFVVNCTKPSTFVIKVTYHPKWRVKIDGKEQPTFMLSPSYIGVAVPSGRHYVLAEYKSGMLKNDLLLLSAYTLLMGLVLRKRFGEIEAWVLSKLKIGGDSQ